MEPKISCTYNEEFFEVLSSQRISLLVTSYQSNAVLTIKPSTDGVCVDYVPMSSPTGLCIHKDKLFIGTYAGVMEFRRINKINSDDVDLPRKKRTTNSVIRIMTQELSDIDRIDFESSDSLFLLRKYFFTGKINIHDIGYGASGIWMVNTAFSCLSTTSNRFNFSVKWKPQFITEITPDNKCHLNGLAMLNGRPKFVSSFNNSDEPEFWRLDENQKGLIIDVDTDESVIEDIVMPHSPRCYNNELYFCESGAGKVCCYNSERKSIRVIAELPGFTRGICFHQNLIFVGLSKLRDSDIKTKIPLISNTAEAECGVFIFDLETHAFVGAIRFDGDLDQIYDIGIIRNAKAPIIADENSAISKLIFNVKEFCP